MTRKFPIPFIGGQTVWKRPTAAAPAPLIDTDKIVEKITETKTEAPKKAFIDQVQVDSGLCWN